ncbi:glycosyltransferase [Haliangium sp.]|uniref:glycosyltransferase n=1 Tax=Haliangium sp. TaxID=2663208 RepID=UPI003D0B467D
MLQSRDLDVSVVLPFGDHEDVIGAAVQGLARHLSERGLQFEILAIDQDAGDNSQAILALVKAKDPLLERNLRVLCAPGRGRERGYEYGARRARGRILWLLEPEAAMAPLSTFDEAYRQISVGERDVVVREGRFALAHRARSGPALDGLKGLGGRFHYRLVHQARARGLAVEPSPRGWRRTPRALRRLLAAFSHGLTY